jgi:hypothetical protein
MAYRRRSSSYSSRGRGRSRYTRRRRTTSRRRSGGTQRIVIQVIGGPGGGVPISATSGKKAPRTLRARY